ncbi:hypothetical protein L2K20_21355 [Mycobacterium sp. MBM]|nr:hypothetical protein [Mycobacterium sp. MBM]
MTLLVGLGCPLGTSAIRDQVIPERTDDTSPTEIQGRITADHQDDGTVGDPVRILAATPRRTGTNSDIA